VSLLGFSIAELLLVAEVLDEGSIREVARRHAVAAGNMSRLLKQVESGCGETLAVRSRTGVRPTEAGRRLVTTISALSEQARAFEPAADVSAPLLGIGAVPFVNTHVIAAGLRNTG
jgi:DNA-binding transcriptional LysR family regulator